MFVGSAVHAPEPTSQPKPKPKKKPAPKPAPAPPAPAKKKSSRKGKPIKVKKTSIEALNHNRPQEIVLSQVCSINGVPYGPGRIRVAGGVARMLMELDRNAQQIEADFHAKRAFIMGPRGLKRQVPYDTFDLEYGNAAPVPLGHF